MSLNVTPFLLNDASFTIQGWMAEIKNPLLSKQQHRTMSWCSALHHCPVYQRVSQWQSQVETGFTSQFTDHNLRRYDNSIEKEPKVVLNKITKDSIYLVQLYKHIKCFDNWWNSKKVWGQSWSKEPHNYVQDTGKAESGIELIRDYVLWQIIWWSRFNSVDAIIYWIHISPLIHTLKDQFDGLWIWLCCKRG